MLNDDGSTALHWPLCDDSQIIVEERRALDTAEERYTERLAFICSSGADVHICNDFVVCFGKLLFFFNGRTSPTMAEVATVLAGNKVYVVAGRNNFARAI